MYSPKETTSVLPTQKNIALITEVKKFPSLYDNSDQNYYVLAERNKAWLEVSRSCGDPADVCHLRWKALRKRFAKEKRKFHEILQGRRRPWALFPKMSFLTPTYITPKINKKPRRDSKPKLLSEESKPNFSDDDMLIVGENNEIVRTCNSGDISEDEYIYETLDDPDSALEIMRSRPASEVKPTAIRSGGALRSPVVAPNGVGRSGRIRKLTPKMQNSMIAKKLKQAQQILQNPSTNSSKKSSCLEQRLSNITKTKALNSNCSKKEKNILHENKTTRHIATVNPNFVRVGKGNGVNNQSGLNGKEPESSSSAMNQPFKVVKLKGRNPLIFSPDQYPEIHSFIQSESSQVKEETSRSPAIKVKSVDNLNKTNGSSTSQNTGDSSNLDIIHSVGLMRKNPVEEPSRVENIMHHNYSRSYSWNQPDVRAGKPATTESKNPPSNPQVHDFETEETWNDIKEEIIDDGYWAQPQDHGYLPHEPMVMMHTPDEVMAPAPATSLTLAKLELIGFQKRLMEEQHLKTLEYMKKEHEMKMTVLRAEIDLKRKQLNIML